MDNASLDAKNWDYESPIVTRSYPVIPQKTTLDNKDKTRSGIMFLAVTIVLSLVSQSPSGLKFRGILAKSNIFS